MDRQEFDVQLFKDEDSNGVGLAVPFDVQAVYGTRAQVKVRGSIDGHPFRGSLAPYGGKHYMGVKKEIRKAIGKGGGDTVHVVMERNTEERTVSVPADFARELAKHKGAGAFFEQSSYTNRKEYVQWIESAKKPETRARRIQQAVERLARGERFS